MFTFFVLAPWGNQKENYFDKKKSSLGIFLHLSSQIHYFWGKPSGGESFSAVFYLYRIGVTWSPKLVFLCFCQDQFNGFFVTWAVVAAYQLNSKAIRYLIKLCRIVGPNPVFFFTCSGSGKKCPFIFTLSLLISSASPGTATQRLMTKLLRPPHNGWTNTITLPRWIAENPFKRWYFLIHEIGRDWRKPGRPGTIRGHRQLWPVSQFVR